MKRREFLVVGGAALTAPLFYRYRHFFRNEWRDPVKGSPYLLSPSRIGHFESTYEDPENPKWIEGQWGMAGFDMRAGQSFVIDTPSIGHSIVGHTGDRTKVLFISQKPGTQCCEIDLPTRRVTQVFNSAKGVFFIGHAAFSQDGKWVYFTESQYGTGGYITKRNTRDYQVEKIFSSGGIEPHELRLIDNDSTIVVANGGVKTKVLSMMPEDPEHVSASISYLDAETGKPKKQIVGIEPRMSPRHLAFGKSNDTFIGLRKFSTKGSHQVPLVAIVNDKLATFKAPSTEVARMKSWLQSLSYCPAREVLAASAPDGNCVTLWDTKNREFIRAIDFPSPDGLTISQDGRHFMATSHKQQILFINTQTLEVEGAPRFTRLNWRHCTTWNIDFA